MRVGCYLDLRNPPRWERPWAEHYARNLERCVEAERLGLDSVWCSEHHFFEDGYLPQPLTFLAGVAATTSRIRLGTAVYLAALRPPVQVAEEAAVVDLPSGGRLELGLGEGLLSVDPALLEPYRAGLAEGGHDPGSARMAGLVNFMLADDPDAAWPRVRDDLAYQWDT